MAGTVNRERKSVIRQLHVLTLADNPATVCNTRESIADESGQLAGGWRCAIHHPCRTGEFRSSTLCMSPAFNARAESKKSVRTSDDTHRVSEREKPTVRYR